MSCQILFLVSDLTVATFYHFTKLDNYEDMKSEIHRVCVENKIKGTVLLAEEGINSTIAGKKENLHEFFKFLKKDPRLNRLSWQESSGGFAPFQNLKVRLKKEIVKLADKDLEFMKGIESGMYIEPEEWGDFIKKEDVKTIDIRNFYETKIGKFNNTIDPNTSNFRDFTIWFEDWIRNCKIQQTQKIAMYCTGGIRCEKSTAYVKKLGFKNVYHLKGGILEYLKKQRTKIKFGKVTALFLTTELR